MMRKSFFLLLFTIVGFLSVRAQSTAQDASYEAAAIRAHEAFMKTKQSRNAVKINLLSLPLRNFSVQYERQVARKISVALGGRLMPEGEIPLKTTVKNLTKSDDPDDDISNQIDNFKIGNYAVTPEVRFYLGKEAMKGFYIAPFARYAVFNVSMPFDIETEDINNNPVTTTIDIKGDLNSIAGGILFGAQFKLSKSIYLDWHFLGPHFGKANGNLIGKKPLTADEQNELRDMIAKLEEIPVIKYESKVDANGAEVKVNGPWGGIRSGLSLVIRF